MGIPAGLSVHTVSAHRLVAAEHILQATGEQMVDSGQTIRGRRPLVKRPGIVCRACLDRLVEDAGITPVREDIPFECAIVETVGKLRKHICRLAGERRISGDAGMGAGHRRQECKCRQTG